MEISKTAAFVSVTFVGKLQMQYPERSDLNKQCQKGWKTYILQNLDKIHAQHQRFAVCFLHRQQKL